MTCFLDVPATYRLVADIGVPRFLKELADTIHTDYLRWPDFDKSPRLACHSSVGVIELMPVADSNLFAFKYVNGHPSNTARGPLHRHGVRRAGRGRDRLPGAAVGTHRRHRAAYVCDVADGGTRAGAA